MALSPAHYLQACIDAAEGKRKATRAMNIGTIGHRLLLGQRDGHRIVKWDGERRAGNVWKEFEAANEGCDIVTAREWAAAELVAQAVREDSVAGPLLSGARYEVPLKWTDGSIACATDGVDVIGRGFIADLKFTNSAEPQKFQRHALNMAWPWQMAFYADGAIANRIDIGMGVLLIAAECQPPYPVTVHILDAPLLEHGRKTYRGWLERLRVCEENDYWPAYANGIVPFTLPPWLDEDTAGIAGDDDEAAA
jgi:hypothetical protein